MSPVASAAARTRGPSCPGAGGDAPGVAPQAPGVISDTPGRGWRQHCCSGDPTQPPRPPTSTGMLQRGCCHPPTAWLQPRATQRHGTVTEGRETSQGQMRITKLSRGMGSSCTPAEGQGRRRSGVSCRTPQISRHRPQPRAPRRCWCSPLARAMPCVAAGRRLSHYERRSTALVTYSSLTLPFPKH